MPIYTIHADREVAALVRSLVRRFVVSMALLLGIGLGSAVVMALSGDPERTFGGRLVEGFWDTLNLISTVGNINHELTPFQQAWAMLVIIFGLGAVLFAFGNLQSLLHGGEVARHFRRLRMTRQLDAYSNHYIVCGYGHMGGVVARKLRDSGHAVVIIDSDRAATERASEDDLMAILGDCEDEETLLRAGVERAAGLLATLGEDSSNVYLVLTSRALNPSIHLVSRATGEQSKRALRRAGVDRCIVPGEIVGRELSQLVLHPRVSEFISSAIGDGDYEFAEIEVSRYPWMRDRTLQSLELPRGSAILVISVVAEDGSSTFNPPPEHVLAADDTLLVVSRAGGIDALTNHHGATSA